MRFPVHILKVPAAVVLVMVLAGSTYLRNPVWQTKVSLWSDVAEKSPRKSRAHNNLGNCYMLLDKPFDAIAHYKAALALDGNNIEAYYNVATNLERVGILNQAIVYYDIFCKFAPPRYLEERRSSCDSVVKLSQRLRK
jgi:tetratricopeptide (TPR) repeat protein